MTTAIAYPPASGIPKPHRVRIVAIPDRRCLAIDGEAEAGGAEFQAAMGALYRAAYALHFLLRERGIDARIGPSEGLWERRDGSDAWATGPAAFDRTGWRWTLLLSVPVEASDDDIASALAVARRKHPSPALAHLYVMTLREGVAVEALHIGPYETEPETIAKMHRAATDAGLRPKGPHHEIYLGDPRRGDPQQLRTVLRQPVH